MHPANAAWSTGTSSSFANIIRIKSSGRGKLPVCVVRKPVSLRFIASSLTWRTSEPCSAFSSNRCRYDAPPDALSPGEHSQQPRTDLTDKFVSGHPSKSHIALKNLQVRGANASQMHPHQGGGLICL